RVQFQGLFQNSFSVSAVPLLEECHCHIDPGRLQARVFGESLLPESHSLSGFSLHCQMIGKVDCRRSLRGVLLARLLIVGYCFFAPAQLIANVTQLLEDHAVCMALRFGSFEESNSARNLSGVLETEAQLSVCETQFAWFDLAAPKPDDFSPRSLCRKNRLRLCTAWDGVVRKYGMLGFQ